MAKVIGSLDEIIEQMVQINLAEDPDYNKGDVKHKVLLHDKAEGEIKTRITQVSKELKDILSNDTIMSENIEFAVASQMQQQMEMNPQIDINQIVVSKQAVLNDLNVEEVYEDEKIESEEVVAAGIIMNELMNNSSEQINKVPDEISNSIQESFEDISEVAHAIGATEEQKTATVIHMLVGNVNSLIELGLKFGELEESDKDQVITTALQLKNEGNEQAYQYYISALGINEQELSRVDLTKYEMNTINTNDDIDTKQINDISARIAALIKYWDKVDPEKANNQEKEIQQLIESSSLGIDGIFKALSEVKSITPNNRDMIYRFLDMGKKILNDPNAEKDVDTWLTSYIIGTAQVFLEKDKDAAKELLMYINDSILKGEKQLTLEDLEKFSLAEFQTMITNSENSKTTLSLSDLVKGYFNKKSTRKIEESEREVTQITQEQKKENLIKSMSGMTKTKGLSKSQEWMDNLITNSPDKDLIAEAIVEFLEKQKETDEHFMDDDAKESRESVFEAIVLSGIKNMDTIKKMKDVDRDTSKKVLDKVIEEYNKTKSGNINAILMLGENIIVPEEKGLEQVSEEGLEQGFLKEPDLRAFKKPNLLGRNLEDEEPDDWSR